MVKYLGHMTANMINEVMKQNKIHLLHHLLRQMRSLASHDWLSPSNEINNDFLFQTYTKTERNRSLVNILNMSQHDKTDKVTCTASEDSDQSGHLPSLISLRHSHVETLGP